ncbi:MAG: aminotransferase class I/II-fold pyridoxal phosphate-dependent enzyme [Christensenella sp.]
MKIETKCLHEGWKPKNGEPHVLPIYQSTTFNYDSTEHVGDLFDLKAGGYFYTRLANPTVGFVEEKIAALEGGAGAMCTSSGQAANMLAVLNIADAGDHIVCASEVYGGTFNLFGVTMKKMGIECTFVDQNAADEEIERAFRKNTKLVFGETIANPAIAVFDIERFADLAHKHGVPLIVDNTFATPILCRPFEFGADIVTHSTSKYMDGHAVQLGGVIVDSGNFDWKNYAGLSEPDDSYHGVIYTEAFGKLAYITKARVQLMRDIGASPTANAAFLLNLGLETLALRMERHTANAMAAAEFLAAQPEVEFVNYAGLHGNKYYKLAQKYLPNGASGVISFSLKAGRATAVKFMDSLTLASNVVHVATAKTCVLHPASSTHRQLSDEQIAAAGITPGMIRLSVGIENIEDIIDDLKRGFAAIR